MLIKGINFPESLLHAHAAGELVIFAGAGVSNPPPSGLPLFGELARRIGANSQLKQEDREPEDRYLGRLKNDHIQVHKFAKRILVNDQTKPHALHHLLVQLVSSADRLRVVTTNFDTHFSTTAVDVFGTGFEIFYAPALPLGEDFTGLVYLHGCAGKDPERCVLTDEDFGRAYLNQAWASRFLAGMFSRYAVLFVGYSHNDTVMNYLARGLPPGNQKLRFAFTEDNDKALSKWKFLGIQPLTYKKCDGENPHNAITISVGEWVSELKRGLLEKAERIRFIAEAKPPLEGEEADYIKFALSKLETANIFFKHANLPEWISWLDKNHFIQSLFQPQDEFTEFHRAAAFWLTEHFFVDHSQEIMAAIQRNGGRLHRQFCWFIWRRLASRDRAPLSSARFSQWVIILLTQPHDILRYDDWASMLNKCRFPEDKTVSILLFEVLTKPRVLLKESWFLFEGQDTSQKVEFDLNLYKDQEHWVSEAWRTLFKPNFPAYVHDLEPIVINHLATAHGLLQAVGRANQNDDSFYLHRQSIERANENGFKKTIDFVVDVAKEIVCHLADNKPQHISTLVEKCFVSEAPILRRLAVYGFGKRTDLSADEKLQWLLQNDLLYHFKTDVFEFLKRSYPLATDDAKCHLIERILKGPVGKIFEEVDEKTKQYEVFNFMVWLKRIAPQCSLTAEKFKRLHAENPHFEEREQPELDFWSGGAQWIEPTEGFNIDDIASGSTDVFLNKLLAWKPRHPMDRSRSSYCSVVSTIVAKTPEWGLSWIQTLVARKLDDSDLWTCVCQGWRNANLTSEQWKSLLDLAEQIEAPSEFFSSFADVIENGSRKEKQSLPDDLMEQAHRVANRIWTRALHATPPREKPSQDWLGTAINDPGGRLAEFWLQRISVARKLAGESWTGLPSDIAASIATMLEGASGAATCARVVFASQLHYFFSLDASFALEKLLPLFDWKTDELKAEQCWHGFVFWGRWLPGFTEQLLPHFDETISRSSKLPQNVREHVMHHIAGIALFRMDNPISNNWIIRVLTSIEAQDREQLAATMDHYLDDTTPAVSEKLWERWLKSYWDMRLLGTPMPLSPKEAKEIACWSLSVGSHFPEAVKLVESMGDAVSFEHTALLYRIDKKGLAKSYPDATADLILFYLRNPENQFYGDDEMTKIWQDLKQGHVDRQKLVAIREELFRRGHDPGEP
jgi:hypothetical protein